MLYIYIIYIDYDLDDVLMRTLFDTQQWRGLFLYIFLVFLRSVFSCNFALLKACNKYYFVLSFVLRPSGHFALQY